MRTAHVASQIVLFLIRHITQVAGPRTCVCVHRIVMRNHNFALVEALATLGAEVSLDVHVFLLNMSSEHGSLAVLALTQVALMWRGGWMLAQVVSSQARLVRVAFLADVAAVRSLSGVLALVNHE